VFVRGGAAGIVITGSGHQLISCQATLAGAHNLVIDCGGQSGGRRADTFIVVQGGNYHLVQGHANNDEPANCA
jgi:hypothetical protein